MRHWLSLLVAAGAAWAGACAKIEPTTPGQGGGTGGSSVSPIPGLASLAITPNKQMITLTGDLPSDGSTLSGSSTFQVIATYNDGTTGDVTNRVSLSIDPATGGTNNGVVTVNGPGRYTVTAKSGDRSATATLTATYSGSSTQSGLCSSVGSTLDGSPAGQPTTIAYPLTNALFPSNFGPIQVHIARGSGGSAPDVARLAFSTDDGALDFKYYGACDSSDTSACYVTLPLALSKQLFVSASAAGDIKLQARIATCAGGNLVESNPISVAWANVPLQGGLYYWTTIPCTSASQCALAKYMVPDPTDLRGTAVMRYNFDGDATAPVPIYTDQGFPNASPMSAVPFGYSPPAVASGSPPDPMGNAVDSLTGAKWGEGRCIGCHSISFDGAVMGFSIGGSFASSFGLLDIQRSTLFEVSPTENNDTLTPMNVNPLKRYRLGNYATFTAFGPRPDPMSPLLMVNMYRGKLHLRSLDPTVADSLTVNPAPKKISDDLFGATTTEYKTDPFWSPKGDLFAFTTYDPSIQTFKFSDGSTSKYNGDTKTQGQIWIATADPTNGPMEGSASPLVARDTSSMKYTSYYPAISYDSALVVFNRSTATGGVTTMDHYGDDPSDGYDDVTATLWLTTPDAAGRAPLKLDNANGGNNYGNSWPRFSPNIGTFRGQKLYWIAFSSRRKYGLKINQTAAPSTDNKPQLWFAGVNPAGEFVSDPSYAAVWLPNQNIDPTKPTGNHVPQWVKVAVQIDATGGSP